MGELTSLLAGSSMLLVAVCAVIGLLIGSFLNVVILRLPVRLQRDWELQSREILGLDVAPAPDGASAPGDAGSSDKVPEVSGPVHRQEDTRRAELAQSPTPVDASLFRGGPFPGPVSGHQRAQVEASIDTLPGTRPSADPPPDLVFSRSRCPRCAHALAPWENIPLLSYALLRGRCRSCREPISPQYPLVEALSGVVFALCAWRFGFTPQLLVALAVGASLIALSVIDAHTQLLPDQITLPLLWFALIVSTLGWTVSPPLAILGATIGYLALWSVYWLFKLATGKEGMGYGDFKLLAALGALTGPAGILPIVLIASMAGAIVGSLQILMQGRDRAAPLPFGPYLAGAGMIQILSGPAIRSAWNAWFAIG